MDSGRRFVLVIHANGSEVCRQKMGEYQCSEINDATLDDFKAELTEVMGTQPNLLLEDATQGSARDFLGMAKKWLEHGIQPAESGVEQDGVQCSLHVKIPVLLIVYIYRCPSLMSAKTWV